MRAASQRQHQHGNGSNELGSSSAYISGQTLCTTILSCAFASFITMSDSEVVCVGYGWQATPGATVAAAAGSAETD